jgi:hypothetical protein
MIFRDRVAQRDVHEGAVGADVADRREARFERRAGVGNRLEGALRGGGLQLRERIRVARVGDEVRVAVDQARKDRQGREIDHRGARRYCN